MKNYQKEATDFLTSHSINFEARLFAHTKYFPDDKEKRDVYTCLFEREGKYFEIRFGQSIVNSLPNRKAPTSYDVLVCLQKYDVGTFEDFCSEFGYDNDSRKAFTTYGKVCEEWEKVNAFFSSEEIEELQNIQ